MSTATGVSASSSPTSPSSCRGTGAGAEDPGWAAPRCGGDGDRWARLQLHQLAVQLQRHGGERRERVVGGAGLRAETAGGGPDGRPEKAGGAGAARGGG